MYLELINRYKKISPVVKASIWFAICSILQKGIQFLIIPIFTRLMSTEQYGQFTLYQSWFNTISIFATLNLAAGVFNNGMVKYENNRQEYISSMQGLSTTATLIIFVVYLLIKPFWDNLIKLPDIVIFAMFIQLLFTPSLSFWSAYQRFEYKYKMLFAVTMGMAILTPVIGLVAVIFLEEKGIAQIMSTVLVNVCFGLVFYIYNGIKGKSFYCKRYWKFALMFNLPLIPHYLSMVVLGQVDRIMIGWFYGDAQVAIYGLSYSISLVMNIATSSINASFIPWTYQQCKKEHYKQIGKVADVLLLAIALVSFLPVLLAPELMAVLAPSTYREGIYLVAPISVSVFLIFLYSLFANIEFYFEKSKLVMIASVGGAILNIVLNLAFLPLCGYQAAAYTTLACYIAFSFAHYIFMKKVCREKGIIENIYNIKRIVALTIGLIVCSQITVLTYDNIVIRLVLIFILAIITYINKEKILKEIKQMKK